MVGLRFIGQRTGQMESPSTDEEAPKASYRSIGRLTAVGASLAVAIPSKLIATVSPAAAYNGQTAANYANVYALSTNSHYPNYGTTDCTNFVSQALDAGGQPPRTATGSVTPTSLKNWWDFSTTQAVTWFEIGSQSTKTSRVAVDLKWFMAAESGWGSVAATYSYASDGPAPPYDSIGTGDILFYNWGGGTGISHAAIQVGSGTTPDNYTGSWVDQHSPGRKQIFWTQRPYNLTWATTTVVEMHVTA